MPRSARRSVRTLAIRAGAVTAGAACALLAVGVTEAHGALDQFIEGDAGCNAFNYPATAALTETPRQSFVPSGSLVSSVGICVESAGAATISIAVRSGSPGAPGSVIGALSVNVAAGAGFAHADFLAPLPVTPGGSYVIEAISDAAVTWRGTAQGVELYPAGSTNAPVGDLAFRSYLAPEPPTATRTATAQPTRTRTRTPTPLPATRTPTPPPASSVVPSSTPVPLTSATAPAVSVLPSTVAPSAAASQSPSPPRGSTTPGTGTIEYTVLISPPDVGHGPQRSSSANAPAAFAIVAAALAAPVFAVSCHRRRLR